MRLKFFAAVGFFCGVLFNTQAQTFKTTQEAVRYYEELVGNLTQQVRTLQDENAKLTGAVFQIQQRLKALEKANEVYAGNLQRLNTRIEEEAQARNKQLNGIADRVQRAANSSASSASSSGGDYDIYEVQSGATLSAIARKAGVSVQEIKSFNHLNSDVLRVGQKLKIPRK